MRLFQILNNQVSIINDNQYYRDTVDNYRLDGGIINKDDSEMLVAVHDSQQDYCEVNGCVLEYPVKFFEDIIDNIDILLAAKEAREYIEHEPPTPEEIQSNLTRSVQEHMDKTAQERCYDDIFTAISYVNSSDPVFAAEASALLLWRDKVWRLCYTILDEVKYGVRPIPSATELLEELPKFEWPEA